MKVTDIEDILNSFEMICVFFNKDSLYKERQFCPNFTFNFEDHNLCWKNNFYLF
jgi:hypothetical protein